MPALRLPSEHLEFQSIARSPAKCLALLCILMRYRPAGERLRIMSLLAPGKGANTAIVKMAIVNTNNAAIGREIYKVTGWREALVYTWLDALEWPGQRTNLRFQRERRDRKNAVKTLNGQNPNPMDTA